MFKNSVACEDTYEQFQIDQNNRKQKQTQSRRPALEGII